MVQSDCILFFKKVKKNRRVVSQEAIELWELTEFHTEIHCSARRGEPSYFSPVCLWMERFILASLGSIKKTSTQFMVERDRTHTSWVWREVDDQIRILFPSRLLLPQQLSWPPLKAAAALAPAASAVIWRVQGGRGSEKLESASLYNSSVRKPWNNWASSRIQISGDCMGPSPQPSISRDYCGTNVAQRP